MLTCFRENLNNNGTEGEKAKPSGVKAICAGPVWDWGGVVSVNPRETAEFVIVDSPAMEKSLFSEGKQKRAEKYHQTCRAVGEARHSVGDAKSCNADYAIVGGHGIGPIKNGLLVVNKCNIGYCSRGPHL